jgi:putative restriction endonuclease
MYFVPVDDDWMAWYNKTVEQPIDLSNAPIEELQDFEEARVWGTTRGKRKRTQFEEMQHGDAVMFYKNREFFATGRVGISFESSEAGGWLWNTPESVFIYTVEDYEHSSIPLAEVNDLLGYSENNLVNGFTRPSETAITNLLKKYQSVDKAFQELRN